MPRGSRMVLEVGVLVFESVRYVFEFTGTITEPQPQSQTAYSPARCRSLSCATVDRLYLKVSVQHTPRL